MTQIDESVCIRAVRALVQMVENSRDAIQQLADFPEGTRGALIEAARRLRQDINLATILQKGLLPKFPSNSNWDMTYYFRPMADVSGDIIDIYTFGDVFFGEDNPEEQTGLLLLDASGHGIASALVTAIARPIFFTFHRLNKDRPLFHSMADANVELCREIGELTSYLTGISVRLEKDSMTYVNAAHPPGLFFRAKTGRITELPNDGIPLGVPEFRGEPLVSRKARVSPGDILFLYTDGLTEAMDAQGEMLGVEAVARCIVKNSSASASEIQSRVIELVKSHSSHFDCVRDDITFIVAKR